VLLLLLLLTELFHELLDLLALLGVVAVGVVHWASRPALVSTRGLVRSLVTMWATTHTGHCCDSSSNGSACYCRS
jgi:hypothetical protein